MFWGIKLRFLSLQGLYFISQTSSSSSRHLYTPYTSHLKIPASEALVSLYCFLKIHTCYSLFLHVGAVRCVLPLGCTSQEFLGLHDFVFAREISVLLLQRLAALPKVSTRGFHGPHTVPSSQNSVRSRLCLQQTSLIQPRSGLNQTLYLFVGAQIYFVVTLSRRGSSSPLLYVKISNLASGLRTLVCD